MKILDGLVFCFSNRPRGRLGSKRLRKEGRMGEGRKQAAAVSRVPPGNCLGRRTTTIRVTSQRLPLLNFCARAQPASINPQRGADSAIPLERREVSLTRWSRYWFPYHLLRTAKLFGPHESVLRRCKRRWERSRPSGGAPVPITEP
jgi:hypothetical protein